jgi:phosphohistidine phosphatase
VQIFLIRHAEAIDETLELRDPHRHLTELGREQARALGERLRWHDCVPTYVWTSPLVRAVQTAELVMFGLSGSVQVVSMPALAPGDDVRALLQKLQKLQSGEVVMIVGHEPILAGLGSLLTGGDDFAALAKAEAARIDYVSGKRESKPRVRWRFAWNDAAPRSE